MRVAKTPVDENATGRQQRRKCQAQEESEENKAKHLNANEN